MSHSLFIKTSLFKQTFDLQQLRSLAQVLNIIDICFNIILVYKMKNFKLLWVTLLSVLLVFSTITLDAQNGNGGQGKNNNRSKKQLKADSTCDSSARYQNFVDANGDGICDNQGTRTNFVDANNDGICDNQGSGRKGKGMKNGQGKGKRNGTCQYNNDASIITTPASPNPFTANTSITFETKAEGSGSVKLYDMNGNLIKNVYEGNLTVGSHTYSYNAENIIPGSYIFKIQQNNVVRSIPVIYSK